VAQETLKNETVWRKYRTDVLEMRDLGAVKVIFFQGPAQGSLESVILN